MKHIRCTSKTAPAKAYYYNVSLTQKLSELTTIATLFVTIFEMFTGGGE